MLHYKEGTPLLKLNIAFILLRRMSCHREAVYRILANVAVFRSTFEGLARCGQPKALPLYLCLNHIWQQVPSTQRMNVFGLLPSCWQARQTMSTHRWDNRQAGWDPLDGGIPSLWIPLHNQ